MGWFSADETVAINSEDGHQTVQTVSMCAIAIAAVSYIIVKGLIRLHKRSTERLAERVARRTVANV